tara:strand:+ start:279 stop:1700 length:1422 start_codon:yes stop_codon:yes gene_type:complete
MNYKGILFFLGINSLIVSFFSLLNILYSFYFSSFVNINSYLLLLVASLIIGMLLCYSGKNHNKNILPHEQLILITSGFVLLPLLISIPYFFGNNDLSFLNSYFESVSGFTATGFSIFNNIEKLEEPLILWRSSSQWIGGLFFLVSIIGTLGSKNLKFKSNYILPGANIGGNFYNNFNSNFFKILLIYFLSTVFIIFLFNLINLRLFDSFNLAFTVISSGGFIPRNNIDSLLLSHMQILIFSITLLFPIFNFFLLFNVFTKEFKMSNHIEDLHLFIFMFFLILFFYFFLLNEEGIFKVFLNIVSSMSTVGISIYNSNLDVSLLFIILLIIGGSAVSTSSGLKYIRFYILIKISYQEIYKLVKPIHVFNQNLFSADVKINAEDAKISFLVFISFILAIFILSSLLALDNLSFENSFKLSILTLTNTVNSSLYGIENINFLNLNILTKFSLIIFMIFAKIEIIAILYLLKKFIFKK